MIALVGELAVPCRLQPAIAGMNHGPRTFDVLQPLISSDDEPVSRNVNS